MTDGTTRHDTAQTVRRLAVFVPLKWHDLARHIAGHCGNKIRAGVRLALLLSPTPETSLSYRRLKNTLHLIILNSILLTYVVYCCVLSSFHQTR